MSNLLIIIRRFLPVYCTLVVGSNSVICAVFVNVFFNWFTIKVICTLNKTDDAQNYFKLIRCFIFARNYL